MTSVLIRRENRDPRRKMSWRHRDIQTQRQRLRTAQAKHCRGPQEARKAPALEELEGSRPCQRLSFRLLASSLWSFVMATLENLYSSLLWNGYPHTHTLHAHLLWHTWIICVMSHLKQFKHNKLTLSTPINSCQAVLFGLWWKMSQIWKVGNCCFVL